MNLSLFFAKRYFFSKKSQNVINIISGISMVGVSVGTMALIIVLSVFNGFENLVISLYNTFDPDIKITPIEGKSFIPGEKFDQLKKLNSIKFYSEVVEDNALLKYKDSQYIATIKGVQPQFREMSGIDTMIYEGQLDLTSRRPVYGLLGQGVAYNLSVALNDVFNPIGIHVPKRGEVSMTDPEAAFNSRTMLASGVFSIQYEFDAKYVIVPLEFAREIFEYEEQVTSIELGIKKGFNKNEVQEGIKNILGPDYQVKNRFEQHELLYRIMKSEKWAVYLILTFILIIATFNVIGSLTMLIIEKQKDIYILKTLGANNSLLNRIFLSEGMMITSIGAAIGLILGTLVCLAQQHFKIIKLQGEGDFVVDAYPVSMEGLDFIAVFFTVLLIGFIASWYPVYQVIGKKKINIRMIS